MERSDGGKDEEGWRERKRRVTLEVEDSLSLPLPLSLLWKNRQGQRTDSLRPSSASGSTFGSSSRRTRAGGPHFSRDVLDVNMEFSPPPVLDTLLCLRSSSRPSTADWSPAAAASSAAPQVSRSGAPKNRAGGRVWSSQHPGRSAPNKQVRMSTFQIFSLIIIK